MQHHGYTEEDIGLVLQLLDERNDRLKHRKTLEFELKQVEEMLAQARTEYESRQNYAPILQIIAEALGTRAEGATKQDVRELEETVEYYVELREHNEARLAELFRLQEQLHAAEPGLLAAAEARQRERERPRAPEPEPVNAALSEQEVRSLFNLDYLRELIGPWIENAHIIVDGYNVIGRVPRYNYRVQEAKLGECRDRLIRELDFLQSQVQADWCVVFDTVHQSYETKQRDIRVIFPEGNRTTSKETGDDRIVEEAKMLADREGCVYVVTNDRELGSRAADVGATILSIGQVFRY